MNNKDINNCPYCLSKVEESQPSVKCPKCGVVHHAECWKANGSCSVYGCDGWADWTSEINERVAPSAAREVELSVEDTTRTATKETYRCIECGKEVGKGQLVCWDCNRKKERHYFDSCFGAGVILIGGFIAITTIIVKVLA
jgi:DNA-directed RNA polymerase subunit RPC12/RpoP